MDVECDLGDENHYDKIESSPSLNNVNGRDDTENDRISRQCDTEEKNSENNLPNDDLLLSHHKSSNQVDLNSEELNLNENTQNSDSGFPNGSLEKMSLVDDNTKEKRRGSSENTESNILDSDDDSEPLAAQAGNKLDLAATVPEKCNMICDNVAIDDDDSAGGGSTSYETASSSVASQSEKPFPFKGTLATDNNGMRCESSSTSNFSFASPCRGRKIGPKLPDSTSDSSAITDKIMHALHTLDNESGWLCVTVWSSIQCL